MEVVGGGFRWKFLVEEVASSKFLYLNFLVVAIGASPFEVPLFEVLFEILRFFANMQWHISEQKSPLSKVFLSD